MTEPDSTREKTAVLVHQMTDVSRTLEKHQAALDANTLANRETALNLQHVVEKLDEAIDCKSQVAVLESRVSQLEKDSGGALLPKNSARYVQIALIVLGALYPALYQQVTHQSPTPVPVNEHRSPLPGPSLPLPFPSVP